jgi:hypothetical protein
MKDVQIGLVARGMYVVGVIAALFIGLAVSTGGHLGVMGMAISGCLLVGLLAADTEPDPDTESSARSTASM